MSDPTKSPHPDARARLNGHFKSRALADHGNGWDALWKEGFLPWDKGFPAPCLVDLLTDREDLLGPSFVVDSSAQGRRRKKALVPGCGKGYDVLLLAAFGYDAYGLDYSETGIEQARKVERELGDQEVYRVRDEKVGRGKVTWLKGDFFMDDFLSHVDGNKNFDLIYDYTFLSALHPSMRPAWSKRFSELLAPTGRIVCLEFPTYKPPSTGGPPWSLPPKIYAAHLPRPGLELPYDEEGNLLEEELGPEAEDGLLRLQHFRPARTHAIGMSESGEVTDWIGVWAHKPVA